MALNDAPRGRLWLVQYPYEFGHMGANYDLDPQKVSKFQLCSCYTSCDEMIKNSPEKVGLRFDFNKRRFFLMQPNVWIL